MSTKDTMADSLVVVAQQPHIAQRYAVIYVLIVGALCCCVNVCHPFCFHCCLVITIVINITFLVLLSGATLMILQCCSLTTDHPCVVVSLGDLTW